MPRKPQPPIDHDAVAAEVRERLNAKEAAKSKPKPWLKTPALSDKCGVVKKSDGKPCESAAGAGTQHIGAGPCYQHGGQLAEGKRSAGRDQLMRLAGRNLEAVSPMNAILMCVAVTAMEVKVFSEKIEELEDIDDLIERPNEQVVAGMHAETKWVKKQKQLNIWIRMRERSMERLVKFSKQALDAGIEERQVKVAERMGDIVSETMRLVFDDLELTPEQLERAPDIVRRRMSQYQISQVAS